MRWLPAMVVFLLVSPGASALPIVAVDMDPATPAIESVRTVARGSNFTVVVRYSADGDPSLVNGFEFDLAYGPALTALAVGVGDFLLAPVLEVEAVPGPPEVRAGFVTVGPGGMAGSGVLASIDFVAPLGVTSMPIQLDLNEVVVAAPFGVEIPLGPVLDGAVHVPEPAFALLLGVGLAALAARREARA